MILNVKNQVQTNYNENPRPVIIAIDFDGTLVDERDYSLDNFNMSCTPLIDVLINLKRNMVINYTIFFGLVDMKEITVYRKP